MAKEINKIRVGNEDYTIIDSTAIHTVDSSLSDLSMNPVQNKVVKAECDNIRAVAEGKSRTFVLSYQTTAPTAQWDRSYHRYYTEDGKELELNPGKTWISIIGDGQNAGVSFE